MSLTRYKMSSVKFMAYVSRIDPVIEETKSKINRTVANFNQIKKESLEGQSLREFLETTGTKDLLMLEKGSQLKSKNIRRIHSSLLKSSIQQHRILVDREKEYVPVVNKLLREYRRKIFSGNFSLLQKPKQKQNLNKMKSELENLLKNHEIMDNSEYTVYNTYFGNADIDKDQQQVSLENVLNKVTDKLFKMTKTVLTENGVEVNEDILQSKIISMQEDQEDSDDDPPRAQNKDKLPTDSAIFKAKAFENERKRLQEQQTDTDLKEFYMDKSRSERQDDKGEPVEGEEAEQEEQDLEEYIENLESEEEVPQMFNENEKMQKHNNSLFRLKLKKKSRDIDELAKTLNNQREEREKEAKRKEDLERIERERNEREEKERREREEREKREREERQEREERERREKEEREKQEREDRERREAEQREREKENQLKAVELEKIKEESVMESEDKNSTEVQNIFMSESQKGRESEMAKDRPEETEPITETVPVVHQQPEAPLELRENLTESVEVESSKKSEKAPSKEDSVKQEENLGESDPKTELESGVLFDTESRVLKEVNPEQSNLLEEKETKGNSLLISKLSQESVDEESEQAEMPKAPEQSAIEKFGESEVEKSAEEEPKQSIEPVVKEEQDSAKSVEQERPPEPVPEEPKEESEKSEEELKEESEESKKESEKSSEKSEESESIISGVEDSELSNALENAESLPRDENDKDDQELEDFTKFNSLIGRNGEVIDLTRQNSKVDDEQSLAKVATSARRK